jgi:hypothetical protein
MKFTGWDCGSLIAKIIDYRHSAPRTCRMHLSVGNAVRRFESARVSEFMEKDELLIERRLLEISKPEICIDPSPSVARFYSVIDWRQKMWLGQACRLPEIPPVTEVRHPSPNISFESRPRVEMTGHHPVEIPMSLHDRVALVAKKAETEMRNVSPK